MQEIIQISKTIIGNDEINSVNARQIHEYLEVKTAFSNWIKRAIKKYDFKENIDYTKITDAKNGNGGKFVPTEYIVTLDMAKELAMLENNPKGKETRKYFIQAEKKLKEIVSVNNLTPVLNAMMEMMKTQTKLLEQLVNKEESKPKTITKEQMKKIRSNSIILCSLILDLSPDKNESEVMRRLYTELNARFGVSSYYDIAKDDYGEVVSFQEKAITRWEKKKELLEEKLNDEDLVIKIL